MQCSPSRTRAMMGPTQTKFWTYRVDWSQPLPLFLPRASTHRPFACEVRGSVRDLMLRTLGRRQCEVLRVTAPDDRPDGFLDAATCLRIWTFLGILNSETSPVPSYGIAGISFTTLRGLCRGAYLTSNGENSPSSSSPTHSSECPGSSGYLVLGFQENSPGRLVSRRGSPDPVHAGQRVLKDVGIRGPSESWSICWRPVGCIRPGDETLEFFQSLTLALYIGSWTKADCKLVVDTVPQRSRYDKLLIVVATRGRIAVIRVRASAEDMGQIGKTILRIRNVFLKQTCAPPCSSTLESRQPCTVSEDVIDEHR